MTDISGPLTLVTEDAAVVTAVWVQAPALRTRGAGAILPQRAAVTLTGSTVSFSCAPGPAVLIWQAGGVEDQVPILVDDVASQTLAEVVSAAALASGRTADELAALVAQVAAGVASAQAAADRAENVATSAHWQDDRLSVMGVLGPPLTGEPGPAGDPGTAGVTPHVGANGAWWVGDTDTGVQAQGPPGAAGDGTGDVLWSDLSPVLDGKADVGHTHTPEALGAAEEGHTHPATDITDSTTVGRSVLTAASQSAARQAIGAGTSSLALGTTSATAARGNHTHSEYATTTMVEARTPEIRVVSALPASPSAGVVYIVTGG